MSRRADSALSRADFHAATGVLLVVREPALTDAVSSSMVSGQPATVPANPAEGVEVLIAVWDDGTVTALHGHVDLGTGLRTALAQIVAEELDVPINSINMVLGNTALAPNQGAMIVTRSHSCLPSAPHSHINLRELIHSASRQPSSSAFLKRARVSTSSFPKRSLLRG